MISVFYSWSMYLQYFSADLYVYCNFQLIHLLNVFSFDVFKVFSVVPCVWCIFQLFHVFDVFFSCSMYLMYFSAVPCIWWTNSNEELYRSCFTIRRRLLCGSWCYYYTTDDEPSKEEVSFVIPYVVWYNQTCIKRSPLGQRKIVLRRHVTS
jgi:hypothetical protein